MLHVYLHSTDTFLLTYNSIIHLFSPSHVYPHHKHTHTHAHMYTCMQVMESCGRDSHTRPRPQKAARHSYSPIAHASPSPAAQQQGLPDRPPPFQPGPGWGELHPQLQVEGWWNMDISQLRRTSGSAGQDAAPWATASVPSQVGCPRLASSLPLGRRSA